MTHWIVFNIALLALILFDLLRPASAKHASKMCIAWICLALSFGVGVFIVKGLHPGLEFVSAYFMELSLSIDNLFVFYLIFHHFKTPEKDQPRILFWGILGALVMRLLFIIIGIALIERFHWILPLFGFFLIFMGVQMFRKKEEKMDIKPNRLTKMFSPFWAALIAIETTDLVFALDSIPAVFGITLDPFIAYTSNAFAVLGLRSFYIAMKDMMRSFSHLHYGIGLILVFIGCKMAVSMYLKIGTLTTFAVMIALLGGSLLYSKKKR